MMRSASLTGRESVRIRSLYRPAAGRIATVAAAIAYRPGRDGREQPEPLEAVADRGGLGLVGLDEREPQAADLVPEQVERALDRDRVRLHPQELDRRPQLLVERARAVESPAR